MLLAIAAGGVVRAGQRGPATATRETGIEIKKPVLGAACKVCGLESR